ncbi:type IV pilus assembly PilZ [Candidatus Koribacter versatilis Ellin345]|uniref:Type IV pilus assembly PilZ n=1 Tax=Koribacter versatilis (strain Ellin345) TaxID=204669 RepID=Q1ILV6_KORVE|nr:PilZ domain-containing protein [Candidatus Koribacter versatilis]ABF42144.1 type IV pilus assembly PilZ [Candidatus Koribacter versatilis Ellin345]
MPGSAGRVNRKLTRFDLDKRVRITLSTDGKTTVFHGRTCDLSEGGMCALISGQLRVADHVSLEVNGLDEGPVSVSAKVRHARGFYYGFEFCDLTRQQSASLVKLITRNGSPKLRARQ